MDILKFLSICCPGGIWEFHSFLYLFGKHLLNTYSVPSSMLGPGTNAEESDVPFWDSYRLMAETDNKEMNK